MNWKEMSTGVWIFSIIMINMIISIIIILLIIMIIISFIIIMNNNNNYDNKILCRQCEHGS